MPERRDEGFSLVEVVIAMFLLAVLALAVLPLVIGATRASVSNKDLVAATAFANAQLAPITADFPIDPVTPTRCADLVARAVPPESAHLDPAGTGMAASIAVAACPGAYPASVPVTVTVRDAAGSAVVELSTLIPVAGS